MHYHSPPHAADSGVMTRSGKLLGSPINPKHHGRILQSPKTRKAKNAKAGKKGLPVIDQPLSVLTRDYKVPVRDMSAWVNRSVEDRMKEVEKKKGYVSRPMNSFMMYRSAYADRVKQFCKENNHQVVSQVTGQSWPMEPQHIREMYEQYAIIERDNHTAAHPNYKFAPNKNGKKRGRDDEESDSDDEWRGPSSTKRSRTGTRGETRSLSSTPFDPDRSIRYSVPLYHQAMQPHPSSYQAINPHGPPPMNLGPAGMMEGYYQPHAVPYGQHIDDVKFSRMDDPFPPYDPASQLIGMPDGTGSELLVASDDIHGDMQMEQMLDPRLAQFDPNYMYGHFDGVPEQSLQIPRSHAYTDYQLQPEPQYNNDQVHPGMATLTEGWPDEVEAGSDFDTEFRKWN